MCVLFHPEKANMAANALRGISMGSVAHVFDDKIELVKEVPRLSWLGVRLEDSPNGGSMVYYNSELSTVVEVKSKKYVGPLLKLMESVLRMFNDGFSKGG